MKSPCSTLSRAICRISEGENGARWYQTLPEPGEYPTPIHLANGTVSGIMVIDQAAYAAVCARFQEESSAPDWPGVLVDREHTSETPDGDTGAMAWAKQIDVRSDGIWTRWDWTSLGEPLATGHVYAYRSPAMDIAPIDDVARAQLNYSKSASSAKSAAFPPGVGRWRPVALSSIALTNKPHLDLAPALGREQSQQGKPNMDTATTLVECRKALKLDDAADVVAAVTKLVSDHAAALAKCTAAETSLSAVQAKQLDADADAFVLLHKARIKNADAVKVQFRKDPEATKALFGSLEDVPAETRARARVLSRAAASTPADRDTASATGKRAAQSTLIATIAARDGISRREAMSLARREKPELWQEESA